MPTRKISISQLRKGMFIHELDISWMHSPFLRHRRKIKTVNDIALLKKAGVKTLTIDLSRGVDLQADTEVADPSLIELANKDIEASEESPASEKKNESEVLSCNDTHQQGGNEKVGTGKDVPLNEELKVAKRLQGKIVELVNQLDSLVKEGRPLSVAAIQPVINAARESIDRNDQALLTMLHLHRQDIKLSDHGFGVFAVVLPLAMRLGCSEAEINELSMAALLHDSGWSRLPMHLIGKNKSYTGQEQRLIQQHPGIVENVLNKSEDFPENVKILVKQHHELGDGSGYPEKLKKKSIYKLVEILQVADFYDEYIHGLTDKPGMLPANALKLLYQAAKKGRYSENVVSELIHVMGIYPLTSAVRLNTGEKALVREIDKQKPLLPKVQIIYDSSGQKSSSRTLIDLALQSEAEKRTIVEIIDPIDNKEDPFGLLRVASVEPIS